VMYDIFPGSISDVSTLSGTLKKIKAHGIQNYVAVMNMLNPLINVQE